MQLNQFNLYLMNAQAVQLSDSDKRIRDFDMINDYNSVLLYLDEMFYGQKRNELTMNYTDENRKIVALTKEDAIEIFVYENDKLIRSKGYRKLT